MARTTRSKAAGTSSSSTAGATSTSTSSSSKSASSRYTLSPESTNPPKIFILPTKATREARIVSLLNPRYHKPTRYLVCPETGIYEFTKIAAPKATPRSWLIERRPGEEDHEAQERRSDKDAAELSAYVTKGADLFVATPIDPLFLLLPALAAPTTAAANKSPGRGGKRPFVPADDHLETIRASSPHLWEIQRWGRVGTLLASRMRAVCDTVEAGDETVYRFSEAKLLAELRGKAARMSERGLPATMEEKFVSKALEAPVVGVRRGATTAGTATTMTATTSVSTTVDDDAAATPSSESGTTTPKIEAVDSQTSVSSTNTTSASFVSEASTAATSVTAGDGITTTAEEETTTTTTTTTTTIELMAPAIQASEEIVRLQRQRVAFNFLCSTYLPPSLSNTVKQLNPLSPNSPTSKSTSTSTDDDNPFFKPLDTYLEQIARLRQEAAASRSMGDYSRKRGLDDDDDEAAERAEKKRRKEEEEKKKKAGESRGVRDLKKVNTSGMRKMSDFFKKKTV
ncbi:hypothetical protein F4778DRAFT_760808 [Xylariomycetidae sp. FL2044]|nr:hypothetical protein F4778DRAFT_760808 [Xylariomycetidae sp. FL2044]